MSRILVAYATMAGSTAEVAKIVGEEIARSDFQVDVLPISDVKDLQPYDAVVVGAPMIMGWHRAALKFLKAHRGDFQRIPLGVFVTAMSLTKTGEMPGSDGTVYVDPKLSKPPVKESSLNFRERYARLSAYLDPILKAARPAKPVRVGFFGGRMEYGRLKWWAVIFAMLIIRAPAGDRRNWPAIREWAASYATWLREGKGISL